MAHEMIDAGLILRSVRDGSERVPKSVEAEPAAFHLERREEFAELQPHRVTDNARFVDAVLVLVFLHPHPRHAEPGEENIVREVNAPGVWSRRDRFAECLGGFRPERTAPGNLRLDSWEVDPTRQRGQPPTREGQIYRTDRRRS